MNGHSFEAPFGPQEVERAVERRIWADRLYLLDLIRVLRPHAAGLRRWSVMRRIRSCREAAGLSISQRLEDEVERVFRNHCAAPEKYRRRDSRSTDIALFHWPQGKGGAVWAVHADRADVWLKTQGLGPREVDRDIPIAGLSDSAAKEN